MSSMRLVIMACFILILIGAIWVLSGCEKQPVTNVYSTNQTPPQQQCQTLTVTAIGNCVPSAQCPPPGHLCQVIVNGLNMIYSCNPFIGQTQQVCR